MKNLVGHKAGRTGVGLNENGLYKAYITHYKTFILLADNVSFDEAVKVRREAELKYYGWVKDE